MIRNQLLINENFHTENAKIIAVVLCKKITINLLCQCQYTILIDTARHNTIVKLTMRYSIDFLVSPNGNLLFEKTLFNLRYFNIKLSLKFSRYLARELKQIRNFSDNRWASNVNFFHVRATE